MKYKKFRVAYFLSNGLRRTAYFHSLNMFFAVFRAYTLGWGVRIRNIHEVKE